MFSRAACPGVSGVTVTRSAVITSATAVVRFWLVATIRQRMSRSVRIPTNPPSSSTTRTDNTPLAVMIRAASSIGVAVETVTGSRWLSDPQSTVKRLGRSATVSDRSATARSSTIEIKRRPKSIEWRGATRWLRRRIGRTRCPRSNHTLWRPPAGSSSRRRTTIPSVSAFGESQPGPRVQHVRACGGNSRPLSPTRCHGYHDEHGQGGWRIASGDPVCCDARVTPGRLWRARRNRPSPGDGGRVVRKPGWATDAGLRRREHPSRRPVGRVCRRDQPVHHRLSRGAGVHPRGGRRRRHPRLDESVGIQRLPDQRNRHRFRHDVRLRRRRVRHDRWRRQGD